jgi:uncharacterized protein (TIGR03437 family)
MTTPRHLPAEILREGDNRAGLKVSYRPADKGHVPKRQGKSAGNKIRMYMPQKRFPKLLLVVLALAIWAGTANAQLTGTDKTGANPSNTAQTFAMSFTKGTVTAPQVSTIAGTGDTYTVAAASYGGGGTGWLTVADGSLSAPSSVTFSINTTGANTLVPGVASSATVVVTSAGTDTNTVTYTINLTVVSPLSATAPGQTALYAIVGGSATQLPAQTTVTITNSDTTNTEAYTLTPTTCTGATWLSFTSAIAGASPTGATVPAGGTDTLTFKVSSSSATIDVTTCSFAIKYNTALITANPTVTFGHLRVLAITASAASNAVTYNKSTGLPGVATATTTITMPASYQNTTFNLDQGTLPQWLTASVTTTGAMAASATSTVTFTVASLIAQGMSTGNYTANIGFYTSVPVSLGLELYVPFTIQISNGNSGVTLLPASSTPTFTYGAVTPQPTATLYATDEPVPYTVTCTVAQIPSVYIPNPIFANGCSLNGLTSASPLNTASNIANGTAFTWGSPVTATLDPALFTSPATIGYTITVTFTYSNTVGSPAPLTYAYTIVPGQAVFAPTGTVLGLPLQPSTMSARTLDYSGTSFNVLVRGSNFYGAKDLYGSAVEGTQVFLGTTQLTAGSYVVMDHNDILVTIPVSMVPVVAAGATGKIQIGLANQLLSATQPTVAAIQTPLTFSYTPAIYAMTSTASYLQPTLDTSSAHLGYIPALAPYELISIFGDNFGFTGNLTAVTSASNALDSYGRYLSPLTLGTPTGAGAKPVTMTVTFKDLSKATNNTWNAPIIFANQNQINAIVPSGMTSTAVPPLYNVTVSTSVGTTATTSDGNFQIDYVAADPGIFTLASDGAGQGAIINGSGVVNGTAAVASLDTIQIYLAGLGAPDSTGGDVTPTAAVAVPTSCVAISQPTPFGLLQQVNAKVPTTWNPAWTSIDGSVLSYDLHHIVEIAAQPTWLNYPPCFSATPTITVTIGTSANHITISGTDGSAAIPYAGFVGGSVAGLYQINALLPALSTTTNWLPGNTVLHGSQPISVSFAYTTPSAVTYTSPAGATILLP